MCAYCCSSGSSGPAEIRSLYSSASQGGACGCPKNQGLVPSPGYILGSPRVFQHLHNDQSRHEWVRIILRTLIFVVWTMRKMASLLHHWHKPLAMAWQVEHLYSPIFSFWHCMHLNSTCSIWMATSTQIDGNWLYSKAATISKVGRQQFFPSISPDELLCYALLLPYPPIFSHLPFDPWCI